MIYNILKKEKLNNIISNSSIEKGATVIDTDRNLTYDRKQNINYLDIYFEVDVAKLLKEKITSNPYSFIAITIMNAYRYDKISCSNFCIPKSRSNAILLSQTLNENDYYIFGGPSSYYLATYTINLVQDVVTNNWHIDSNSFDTAEIISCYIDDKEITKENAPSIYLTSGKLKIKIRRFYHNRYVNIYKYRKDMSSTSYISDITKRLYSNYENDFKTIIKIMPSSYSGIESYKYTADYLEMCDLETYPHFYNLICLPQKFDDAYIVYENNYVDNIEDFYNDYVNSGWNTIRYDNYYITYQYSNIGYLSGICNTIKFGGADAINTFQNTNIDYGNPLAWSFKPTADSRHRYTLTEYKNDELFKKCKSYRTITCKTSYDIDSDYEYINYIDYNNIYRKKWGNILKQTTTITINNELRNAILGLPNSFTTWR